MEWRTNSDHRTRYRCEGAHEFAEKQGPSQGHRARFGCTPGVTKLRTPAPSC